LVAVSAFLGVRAIAGVEAVEGGCYRRTVRVPIDGKEHTGWIAVEMSPGKPTLASRSPLRSPRAAAGALRASRR